MDLKIGQWASDPPVGYPGRVVVPTGKQEEGWTNGEEPPAGYVNQAFAGLADLQNEVANTIEGAGLTLAAENLAQLLAAIRAEAAAQGERMGITQWRDLVLGGSGALRAVATSPTDLVAVGIAAAIRRSNLGDGVIDSPSADGSFTDNFLDVCWYGTGGVFIACGDGDEIQTSPTGATWMRRETTGDTYRCCAAGAAFAACGGDNGTLKTTSTGTSFSLRTSAHGTKVIYAMAYSPTLGRIVAVGEDGTVQRSNTSGNTWTAASDVTVITAAGAPTLLGVVWSPEQGLFFARGGGYVFKSPDGLVWSAATGAVTFREGSVFTAIVALPQHLVAFGERAVKLFRYSDLDGTPTSAIEITLLRWGTEAGSGGGDVPRPVRIPPDSGNAFAGHMLAAGLDYRIIASPYFG